MPHALYFDSFSPAALPPFSADRLPAAFFTPLFCFAPPFGADTPCRQLNSQADAAFRRRHVFIASTLYYADGVFDISAAEVYSSFFCRAFRLRLMPPGFRFAAAS